MAQKDLQIRSHPKKSKIKFRITLVCKIWEQVSLWGELKFNDTLNQLDVAVKASEVNGPKKYI